MGLGLGNEGGEEGVGEGEGVEEVGVEGVGPCFGGDGGDGDGWVGGWVGGEEDEGGEVEMGRVGGSVFEGVVEVEE